MSATSKIDKIVEIVTHGQKAQYTVKWVNGKTTTETGSFKRKYPKEVAEYMTKYAPLDQRIEDHGQRVFAIDNSGSTQNEAMYHQKVLELLRCHRDGDQIIAWNSEAEWVDIDTQRNMNSRQYGKGNTCPVTMLPLLEQSGSPHLILVTDGEVDFYEIDGCDTYFKQSSLSFSYVDAIVISSNPSLSVTCPFTRSCEHKVISVERGRVETLLEVTQNDIRALDKIDTINTVGAFARAYDPMRVAMTSKLLGTCGDQALKDQVVNMKTRIDQTSDGQAHESQVESMIKPLIQMCDGDLRYAFTPYDIDELMDEVDLIQQTELCASRCQRYAKRTALVLGIIALLFVGILLLTSYSKTPEATEL